MALRQSDHARSPIRRTPIFLAVASFVVFIHSTNLREGYGAYALATATRMCCRYSTRHAWLISRLVSPAPLKAIAPSRGAPRLGVDEKRPPLGGSKALSSAFRASTTSCDAESIESESHGHAALQAAATVSCDAPGSLKPEAPEASAQEPVV